jgi:magnesium-transporting ATPase (P-type)
MISGDHVETAKRTALKAGIVSEADLENPNTVMEAEAFRDLVGGLVE